LIELLQLDKQTVWLQPDHLLRVEARPDTVVTLTNGDKLVVFNTPQNIMEQLIAFKRACYSQVALLAETD
jgi:flagellar protein FlbD